MKTPNIVFIFLFVIVGTALSAASYNFLSNSDESLFNITDDGNVNVKENLTIGDQFFGRNSLDLFVGVTPLQYKGNMTNGSLIGYEAANAICSVYYPGSHFCLEIEVMKTNNVNSNIGGQMWTAKGAPGYTAAANDCEGWTKTSGEIGPFWDYTENDGVGAGKLTPCSSDLNISCCGGSG